MLLKVLFAMCICFSIILTPLFLRAQRPGKSIKSLTLKMLDSTCFLSVGILSMVMAQNFSDFAKLLLTALVLSWLGDFFLHLNGPFVLPAIGFLGFLTSHVFYIIAYANACLQMQPGRPFLQSWEIAVLVVFVAAYAVFLFKGLQMKPAIKPAILLYAITILTMLMKAVDLAVVSLQTGAQNAKITAVLAIGGAVLFVASDLTISVLMFDKEQKSNFPLKIFNIVTYFAGQLLLASLILTV